MIEDSLIHRIAGYDLLGPKYTDESDFGWDEDFHDAEIVSIHYYPNDDNGTCDIIVKPWVTDEKGHHHMLVTFHFEQIKEFHINNQCCNFTTCMDIWENPRCNELYYKDCMDFLLSEIGVTITAPFISITKVEQLYED